MMDDGILHGDFVLTAPNRAPPSDVLGALGIVNSQQESQCRRGAPLSLSKPD
jgi:hypothetical protein